MLKILKFGGTSVASLERIRSVAEIIKKHKQAGDDVVVVVSAMAGFTNKMVSYTEAFTNVDAISKSLVHSCGEQISSGLLAAALAEIGLKSCPLLGWQVPIVTSKNPFNAWIKKIETENLNNLLKNDTIPVVTGFQGVTEEGYISTLGRGGSDTTAVAVGVALKADLCYIYTDVEGIYNKDPNSCKDSILFQEIDYEKMLEMSKAGAKVVHSRAALLSNANDLNVIVLSTFNQKNTGTLIKNHKKDCSCSNLESIKIKSVINSSDFALVTITHMKEINNTIAKLFDILNKGCVSIDMLNCLPNNKNGYNISFMVEKESLNLALTMLNKAKSFLNYENIKYNSSVKKISVVGHCLISSCDFLSFMFSALNNAQLNAKLIWASESRVSLALSNKEAEIMLRKIYNKYEVEE